MAKAKDDKTPAPAPERVRIRAAHDGFRRAGRAWTREWQEIDLAELDADQIAALDAEPLISIEPVIAAPEQAPA